MTSSPAQSARDLARHAVARALENAQAEGALPQFGDGESAPAVEVVRPDNTEHGDLSTNLALQLAGRLKRPPRAIAEALAERVTLTAGEGAVARAEVAGPGFVNLWLAPGYVEGALDAVRRAGSDYGRMPADTTQSINVEFVSANPTGPLTIGNARGAFVGDLLCRVLEAVGHEVTREYYFNDFGTQVANLGKSVLAVRQGQPLPDDGYRGDYVNELAAAVPADVWAQAQAEPERAGWILGEWASERVRAGIEASLEHLGVHFDVWKSEGSLHREGWVERAVGRLRESGHAYEQEGALWFRSTDYGDDKDRVVIRSNGQPTYLAADVGYLIEKFSRDFDRLIYIWGADHHGTVARLRGGAQALGFDREQVHVLLIAWVRFVREGREISMSKRSGEFITLDELLAEVGVDAARWFFASRSPSTGIDFDIELARKQSNENPVYYVQYAHARISSILRKAASEGLAPAPSLVDALEGDEVSLGLAKELLRLPDVVRDAAQAHETQAITTYATSLATTFHAFYRDRRVVDADDPSTSGVRLALVDATRITLANALGLLGISAPESM
ncbi:MAG TPA: arginine--tRNA ligase [Candidatus Limnocylindria bacterium]|nr:arginine--tRNA ligase [Candidatus Limnocylindria bacterium]